MCMVTNCQHTCNVDCMLKYIMCPLKSSELLSRSYRPQKVLGVQHFFIENCNHTILPICITECCNISPTAATPTCRALQRLSESAQFLSCNRNDECNAIHCNVTFGQIQAQLNMVNFTLLPCNLPPTVRLSGIDNSGSVILDRVLSESQNIPLVNVITLNISVLQLTNAIGLEVSACIHC